MLTVNGLCLIGLIPGCRIRESKSDDSREKSDDKTQIRNDQKWAQDRRRHIINKNKAQSL
jgi:hypothetical protein